MQFFNKYMYKTVCIYKHYVYIHHESPWKDFGLWAES